MAEKKKAALDSFFNKSKKKTGGRAHGDYSGGSDPTLPASSSAWVDEPDFIAPSHVVAADALKARVTDYTEADLERLGLNASSIVDVDALHSKKQFSEVRKAAALKTKGKAADPSGEASSGPAQPMSWMAARRAGAPNAKLDTKSSMQFPTLKAAASGIPLGAQLEPPKDITKMAGTGNAWAAFATEDADEEDDVEAEEEAGAAEAKETESFKPKGVLDIEKSDLILIAGGGEEELTSADDVQAATLKIVSALKGNLDVDEANAALLEMNIPEEKLEEWRGSVVELLIQSALDCEKRAERFALSALLSGLVLPTKFCTAKMLKERAQTFLTSYDDLLIDYPLLAEYFADIFGPLVPTIVAFEALPADVAAALKKKDGGKTGKAMPDRLSNAAADLQDRYGKAY